MSQNFSPNLSGDGGVTTSINTQQFRNRLEGQYGHADDLAEAIGMAVDDYWPVGVTEEGVPVRRQGEFSDLDPSFREHQRDAVIEILYQLYVENKDVVTLSAPTGAGKSLILHGAMFVIGGIFRRSSFFTTPLNALLDQVENDDFIADDVITMKGKNNYQCVHPEDRGTSVSSAICQRDSNFECQYKDQHHTNGGCPYYGRKRAALDENEVDTNMSYLMANAMIPDAVDTKFQPREVMEVDECQRIEDFALGFVGFTVSKRTVPVVYEEVSSPPKGEDVDKLAKWLRNDVLFKVMEQLQEYETAALLNEKEARDRDKLQEFKRKVENFLGDVEDHHWVAETDLDGDWKVKFNPIFVGRFLENFLWSQGQKIILSSATIPRGGFLEEIGLDEYKVGEVEVPSTFPPGRRPVYTDMDVGKMTYNQRDRTTPKMAQKIADLARHHDEHKGFIHCHSYSIAASIYDALPSDVKGRARVQDSDEREEALEAWLKADVDETSQDSARHVNDEEIGGQIFLSVAMDEGISLDDDDARWQVVAKAAYPNMQDKRVDYRLNELDDWTWYAGSAAIALQQAVGRGMRSKDDWCHTYILDTSATQLIERNEYLFEDWFLDAIDVVADDDLPEGRA